MKYDLQIAELQRLLSVSQNILVVLPQNSDVDNLAAGLALFLSLEQTGKEVAIASEGVIRVGHTNLFGVGQIQSTLPQTKGGNLAIILGGVVDPAIGKPPALEKLDWFAEGSDLKLVFLTLPGQKFEPTHITPRFEGGSWNVVFVVGATNLEELGSLYSTHQEVFSRIHLVNIDNQSTNSQFGQTKIVDPGASSLSEIIMQLLPALGLPVNGDISSNILNGIFAATADLGDNRVNAETYEVVAQALRAGGHRPGKEVSVPPVPASESVIQSTPFPAASQPGFDLSKLFPTSVPPVVSSLREQQKEPQPLVATNVPSPEERPGGEGVVSEEEVVTPGSDWLTPKIFKGTNLG